MQRIKQAAPQLLEFTVKYYLNNALWEAGAEVLAAAFGVPTLKTVAALVIRPGLEEQLLHLQELLPSVLILRHSSPSLLKETSTLGVAGRGARGRRRIPEEGRHPVFHPNERRYLLPTNRAPPSDAPRISSPACCFPGYPTLCNCCS